MKSKSNDKTKYSDAPFRYKMMYAFHQSWHGFIPSSVVLFMTVLVGATSGVGKDLYIMIATLCAFFGLTLFSIFYHLVSGISRYSVRGVKFTFTNDEYWVTKSEIEKFIQNNVVDRFNEVGIDFDPWEALHGTSVVLESGQLEWQGDEVYGLTWSERDTKFIQVQDKHVLRKGVMDYELSHIVMEHIIPGGTEKDFLDWKDENDY